MAGCTAFKFKLGWIMYGRKFKKKGNTTQNREADEEFAHINDCHQQAIRPICMVTSGSQTQAAACRMARYEIIAHELSVFSDNNEIVPVYYFNLKKSQFKFEKRYCVPSKIKNSEEATIGDVIHRQKKIHGNSFECSEHAESFTSITLYKYCIRIILEQYNIEFSLYFENSELYNEHYDILSEVALKDAITSFSSNIQNKKSSYEKYNPQPSLFRSISDSRLYERDISIEFDLPTINEENAEFDKVANITRNSEVPNKYLSAVIYGLKNATYSSTIESIGCEASNKIDIVSILDKKPSFDYSSINHAFMESSSFSKDAIREDVSIDAPIRLSKTNGKNTDSFLSQKSVFQLESCVPNCHEHETFGLNIPYPKVKEHTPGKLMKYSKKRRSIAGQSNQQTLFKTYSKTSALNWIRSKISDRSLKNNFISTSTAKQFTHISEYPYSSFTSKLNTISNHAIDSIHDDRFEKIVNSTNTLFDSGRVYQWSHDQPQIEHIESVNGCKARWNLYHGSIEKRNDSAVDQVAPANTSGETIKELLYLHSYQNVKHHTLGQKIINIPRLQSNIRGDVHSHNSSLDYESIGDTYLSHCSVVPVESIISYPDIKMPGISARVVGAKTVASRTFDSNDNISVQNGLNAWQAYRKASDAIWNFDLYKAELLLSVEENNLLHKTTLLEIYLWKALLLGKHSILVECLAEADRIYSDFRNEQFNLIYEVALVDLNLIRLLGSYIDDQRVRSAWIARQCWSGYLKLVKNLDLNIDEITNNDEVQVYDGKEDIVCEAISRTLFGVGLMHIFVSAIRPLSILCKIEGIVVDKDIGIACLRACMQDPTRFRAPLSAVVLTVHVLLKASKESTIKKQELLNNKMAFLTPQFVPSSCVCYCSAFLTFYPHSPFLNWLCSIVSLFVGSTTCLQDSLVMLRRALWCCGPSFQSEAAYMRYELGWSYFLRFQWSEALSHFKVVTTLCYGSDPIVLPDRRILCIASAACAHRINNVNTTESLLNLAIKDCQPNESKLSKDFQRLAFLYHRRGTFQMLDIEMLYFCHQFRRMPDFSLRKALEVLESDSESEVLLFQNTLNMAFQSADSHNLSSISKKQSILEITQMPNFSSYFKDFSDNFKILVCTSLYLRIVLLCHLNSKESALPFLEPLVCIASLIPEWCNYLTYHSYYWCGRVLLLMNRHEEATEFLRKCVKKKSKYLFNIEKKALKLYLKVTAEQ